jgi:hypothetical protein
MVSSAGYHGPKMANPQGQTLVEEQSQQRPTSAMARIQSLAPFHKRATPTPPPTPLPSTIVQDGTYLNTLGLKLNEAASRVLVTANGTGPDVWKGKKPLPSGRGRQFAAAIETCVISLFHSDRSCAYLRFVVAVNWMHHRATATFDTLSSDSCHAPSLSSFLLCRHRSLSLFLLQALSRAQLWHCPTLPLYMRWHMQALLQRCWKHSSPTSLGPRTKT